MARLVPTLTLLLGFVASPLFAQGYGDVKGRIVFDGRFKEPDPRVEKGAAKKDANICAVNADIADPSLVVDKDGGIANVFIYLPKAPADIHPMLAPVPKQPVLQDQKDCVFTPHALFVRAGQGVNVTSQDGCAHNTHTNPIINKAVNFLLPPKPATPTLVETPKAEFLPIKVNCDIHPWMDTYWLILDHPYATVSKEDGTFEIKGLPAGKHDIRIWHERAGYLEKALEVEVKANGTTDLEDLEFKAREFK